MNSYSKTALAAAICTALSAGHAGAATFNVINTDDSGAGSLRDALSQAGANGEADIIDLASISGQTISLSSGQLEIDSDDVTINGAGSTVDAGGNSRVMATYYSDVTINDLTITGGDAESLQPVRGISQGGAGGGIYAVEGNLDVNDSDISGNSADVGGGVYFYSEYGSLNVNDSVVSGNNALYVGGGVYATGFAANVTLTGTEISTNTSGLAAGGLAAYSFDGSVSLVDSNISNNTVTGAELPNPTPTRAFAQGRDALAAAREAQRDGSPWETLGDGPGGPATYAGGAGVYSLVGDIEIIRTTISGNSAGFGGGVVANTYDGSVLVDSSTISGNSATDFAGAGVLQAKYDLQVRNSTISGNSSGGLNGGLVLYSSLDDQQDRAPGDGRGTPARNVAIEFTTITDNSAVNIGGLGISSDIPFPLTASVISGNSASTDPDVGFQPYATAQADLSFTLVGVDSTSGTLNFDAASSSLLGQDPLLGPLADNGGPTFTHLPGDGSPLINAVPSGSAGCGSTVVDDQGGQSRPVDGACDIGSVERGPVAQPAVAVPVMDRIGLLLMAGLLGLAGFFGFRRRSQQKF